MTDGVLNVHMYLFDDLAMAKEAVASVPGGFPIHLVDGRYADFPGDYNLTPGAQSWAATQPDVTYHAPPDDLLPFGDPNNTAHRRSTHEKAKWVNYDVLPPAEWTLKLDSDERLVEFDWERVADLDPGRRWRIQIEVVGEPREWRLTRLWQPNYWTVWANDLLLPRSEVPRDTELERLQQLWNNQYHRGRGHFTEARIINYGVDRPQEYNERRVEHLHSIGRDQRASDFTTHVLEQN